MTRRRLRYVGVEYRGGPKDGDRDVLPCPPPPDIRFPRAEAMAHITPETTAAEAQAIISVCHRYAATDHQHCEPFEVTELQLVSARDPRSILEDMAATRAPFVYTWQGAE